MLENRTLSLAAAALLRWPLADHYGPELAFPFGTSASTDVLAQSEVRTKLNSLENSRVTHANGG